MQAAQTAFTVSLVIWRPLGAPKDEDTTCGEGAACNHLGPPPD